MAVLVVETAPVDETLAGKTLDEQASTKVTAGESEAPPRRESTGPAVPKDLGIDCNIEVITKEVAEEANRVAPEEEHAHLPPGHRQAGPLGVGPGYGDGHRRCPCRRGATREHVLSAPRRSHERC
ncbi:uncharacterized protein LOC123446229 [Hordeum vulgare subsp. vulgare]|uniref:uncharacterized protein LOC123446229 n=1 Tax=Hordeum vulgare subsp. vulgare TaxID=112509 RepID=UPI00162EB733|nr:uncharacterized protein LOC123446229 [Hordeum vulgare subsp. vulgare]